MKAIVKIWHQKLNMKDMKTYVSCIEKEVGITLKDDTSRHLMKCAIEGDKSFIDEFDKHFEYNNADLHKTFEEIGNDCIETACRMTLEFPILKGYAYVVFNKIGKIKKNEKYRNPIVPLKALSDIK